MRRIGLTFVHGISNGPSDRLGMRDRVLTFLSHGNASEIFKKPENTDRYVWVAQWESVGDFFMDLAVLTKADWRNKAIQDISNRIFESEQQLLKDCQSDEPRPLHIVLMHSMGQPLGISALAGISKSTGLKLDTIVISIGGPLGNKNPIFKDYLSWCFRPTLFGQKMPKEIKQWIDVANHDDPICCDPAIEHLTPKCGYQKPKGVTSCIESPGKLNLHDPMQEHSSYFTSEKLFDLLRKIAQG